MAEFRTGIPAWIMSRIDDRAPGQATMKVLEAVGAHPREMSYASTSAAADRAGVNVATVVRTAQMMGFAGWPALRAEIRSRYLASLSASQVLSEHGAGDQQGADGAPLTGVAATVVAQELQNLHDLSSMLDAEQIERTARALFEARTTLVLGSGSFAAPGVQLSHLAQTIGHDIRMHQVGGSALFNAVSLLEPTDCLVVFHLWRSPRELINATAVAADQGVRVILVTDQLDDALIRSAAEVLRVPSEGASMFPSIVGAITTVQALIAGMVAVDSARAAAASDRAERQWRTYDVFPPPSNISGE